MSECFHQTAGSQSLRRLTARTILVRGDAEKRDLESMVGREREEGGGGRGGREGWPLRLLQQRQRRLRKRTLPAGWIDPPKVAHMIGANWTRQATPPKSKSHTRRLMSVKRNGEKGMQRM